MRSGPDNSCSPRAASAIGGGGTVFALEQAWGRITPGYPGPYEPWRRVVSPLARQAIHSERRCFKYRTALGMTLPRSLPVDARAG